MKKNKHQLRKLVYALLFVLGTTVACNDDSNPIEDFEVAPFIPNEIVGEWVGAKIEIFDRDEKIVYNEREIRREILPNYLPDAQDQFINFWRNRSVYQLDEDGIISLTTINDLSKQTETVNIKGILYPDKENENIYHAVFDTKSTGLPDLESYKRQSLTYSEYFIVVRMDMEMAPLNYDVITYYKPK